ncbi:MAG: MBOAT family protein [Deltaproteobacteria bacterium]|nr:MBOAT family protein [Deltaproteobacteria bacterium]
MLFNSFEFFIFFVFVLTIYYLLNRKSQNVFLLAASYLFYGFWDWRFLFLLFVTSAVDYFISHIIHVTENPNKRKHILLISLVANLGVLGFFKYYNFFIDNFMVLTSSFGMTIEPWLLNVILPVGISFYTLQSMSYTIDVYRRNIIPCSNFLDFLLYVSFFPQLVAGPIERASNLIPQLQQKRIVNYEDIRKGCFLILFGLFQKVVIADNLGIVVDKVFSHPAQHSGVDLIIGTYAFAFQIYCDFSGYSSMAIGIARLLGIELMTNFKAPYLSASPGEFWHRWHISLSTWLKDYLYIPLGGNRSGNIYMNLMLTMLIGGLWHGANWTMLIWGGMNGLYLVVNRKLSLLLPKRSALFSSKIAMKISSIAGVLITFNLICIAWIFFRATTLTNAVEYLSHIYVNFNWGIHDVHHFSAVALGLMGIMLSFDILYCRAGEVPFFCMNWGTVRRALVYTFLLISIIFFGVGHVQSFIYFQF